MRYATIQKRASTTVESVANYLPRNYRVVAEDDESIAIAGVDNAGWTLDGYVIPRLGSGMIFAHEANSVQWDGREATVQTDEDGMPIVKWMTCGVCGRRWNDALITGITPTPSARCPFEYAHEDEDETADDFSWSVDSALWQIGHGEPKTDRTDSAYAYLLSRDGNVTIKGALDIIRELRES